MKKLIKEYIGPKGQRLGKNFAKYLVVGIIWTFLSIYLIIFTINLLEKVNVTYAAFLGTALVTSFLFFLKYFAYRIIRFIKPGFIKYASTVVFFAIAQIIFMGLLVDFLKIDKLISSIVVVGSLFILRFLAFGKIGLMKGGV